MSSGYKRALISLGLMTSVALPFAASAQSNPTQNPERTGEQLEDIVVTAQRRSESSQSIPISITAISGDNMQKLGITSMYDLQFATPGLVAASQAGNAIPFLRGVGSTIAFVGSDSSVSTYVDGYYIAYVQGTMQDLFDAERVEVLKGPQATLYGRNATGGAINYISRQPNRDKLTGKAAASYGSDNEVELKAYLTGPLSNTLAFSVAGLYRHRDSYIDVVAPAPAGVDPHEEIAAGRAKLLFTPGESYTSELSVSYSKKHSFEDSVYIPMRGSDLEATALGAQVTYADEDKFLSDQRARNEVRQWMVHLTQTFDLGQGMTLKSLSGFADTVQKADIPLDGSLLPLLSFGSRGTNSRQYSQDFQLLSDPQKRFSWIIGASYFRSNDKYDPLYNSLPFASQLLGLFSEQISVVEQHTKALAGFGEGTFRVADGLSITGGVRYTDEQRKILDSNYTVFNGIPNPSPFFDCTFAGLTFGVNCGGAGLGLPPIPPAFVGAGSALNGLVQPIPGAKRNFGKWSYRGTVRYEPAQDISIYYTYSRGFKSGTFNMGSLSTAGNVAVDPEVITSHELGLKSEWLGRRLRFNAALFHYKIAGTQAQVLVGGSSGTSILANAGDAVLKGAEVELAATPLHGLQISVSAAYVNSSYKDFDNYPASLPMTPGGGTTGAGGNITMLRSVIGNPLPYAPKFTSNMSASYNFDLQNSGSIVLNGLWSYNDGYCLEQLCRGRQGSFHTVNASISYQTSDERLRFTLFGKNLTNDRYLVNYLQLPTGDLGRYSRPRWWGASAEYNF